MRQPQLPPKTSDWPVAWREAFEERAGIMEFQGNMPRDTAEFWAEKDVRRQFQEVQ
jgi:hypothetical protein